MTEEEQRIRLAHAENVLLYRQERHNLMESIRGSVPLWEIRDASLAISEALRDVELLKLGIMP